MEYSVFGIRFRIEVVIICLILGAVLGCHLLCSCCRISLDEWKHIGKESFTDMVMKLENGPSCNSNKMKKPMKDKLHPVGNDDASMLASSQLLTTKTMFTPESCANCPLGADYSSSTGCAKLSSAEKKLMMTRGGNSTMNIPIR